MPKAKIVWDEAVGAAENAGYRLPPLVHDYFEQGRAVAAADAAPDALHRFRLRTKRLRYTLEMFRPFYGPGLESCLGRLHEVQRLLGDANDCDATLRLLGGPAPASSATGRRLEAFLKARAAERVAEFRNYWLKTFDAAGEEARWRRYLSRTR
jgi:CHAD domain-containing protein